MGEQLIRAASFGDRGQVFTSTRFGNVLGSRGSVLPIFKRQIKAGGPVTLTSAEMTRFVMTLDEAVNLVLEAAAIARGGDVFITKMATVRIIDLAEVMIEELAPNYGHRPQDIAIEEIGPRPGEKFYEELMTTEEMRRSIELEHHFVMLPALTDLYTTSPDAYPDIKNRRVLKPYHSSNEPAMSKDELRKCLVDTGLHTLEMDS
jgi:FlaA1/EpsC-like NDP-sugar epimerase